MLERRVIPIILLQGDGLVKGKQYKNHRYVGDPINTVRIFNEKEVDELIIFDIGARQSQKGVNFKFLENISSEAFMPMGYGGGISSLDEIKKIFSLGFEKVILNTSALENHKIITEAAKEFGSQSIVICIDVKKNLFTNYGIVTNNATVKFPIKLNMLIKNIEESGAGEIIISSVNNEGEGNGCDITLIKKVDEITNLPLIATGGVNNLEHIHELFSKTSVSGVGIGRFSVFYGKHEAVLISYPSQEELEYLREI